MAIETRTHKQCFISPTNSTAFISPTSTKSASSSTRKRTKIPSSSSTSGRRMTLFTLIYISLAVITLFLSPSAYAEGCTPLFILRNSNGTEGGPHLNKYDEDSKNEVVVREGSSFMLACELSRFHNVKWTINNREITPQIQEEWDIFIDTEKETNGYVYSQLVVNYASIKFHPGEYKCTSVCLGKHAGANLGVKVTVSSGLNVTLSTNNKDGTYKEYVPRGKFVDITCTAHVPEATMKWLRIVRGIPENMDTICGVPDIHLSDRKKPPVHCKVTYEGKTDSSVLKLHIKRVRKEANITLGTIGDYQTYRCEAQRGASHGYQEVQLVERISATRSFEHRGAESLTVTEGDKLEIYCDIHGVELKEFEPERGVAKAEVKWTKDGKEFTPEFSPDVQRIGGIEKNEKGSPYRIGFRYIMAEKDHRGNYSCVLTRSGEKNRDAGGGEDKENPEMFAKHSYYVRVKDKLGALWPFLGICVEVIILCTIILIYERRKSKAELQESDTDGSPDQNNSNSND